MAVALLAGATNHVFAQVPPVKTQGWTTHKDAKAAFSLQAPGNWEKAPDNGADLTIAPDQFPGTTVRCDVDVQNKPEFRHLSQSKLNAMMADVGSDTDEELVTQNSLFTKVLFSKNEMMHGRIAHLTIIEGLLKDDDEPYQTIMSAVIPTPGKGYSVGCKVITASRKETTKLFGLFLPMFVTIIHSLDAETP
jgi:hypothetical protein